MQNVLFTPTLPVSLLLAHVWETSGKPDLGHQRAFVVRWTSISALCGPELGQTNILSLLGRVSRKNDR